MKHKKIKKVYYAYAAFEIKAEGRITLIGFIGTKDSIINFINSKKDIWRYDSALKPLTFIDAIPGTFPSYVKEIFEVR